MRPHQPAISDAGPAPDGNSKRFFYDRFAPDFDKKMNRYDLETRLRLVFDRLLPRDLQGKKLLDAGCGTGFFSQAASSKGADVTSMDMGQRLLDQVALKCRSNRVIGSVLQLAFRDESFDLIICSEVIEHTDNPLGAIGELYRVLRPGGTLALTVPNRFWKWSCSLANVLRLRPYEGMENWVGYGALRRCLLQNRFEVTKYFGFHLFPFQLTAAQPILRRMDRYGSVMGPIYINIGAACRK